MKAKVIGIGAAGNKAAINLIEKEIISSDDVLLVNSTLRDVPEDYKHLAVQFDGSIGGCGKERELAKNLCIKSLRNDSLKLDSFVDPDDKMVIIVNSSEGGTGCGSSIMMGRYIKDVTGHNVSMYVLTGFEEDGRGLQNTVEYFKEIEEGFTVQTISNKKFLSECGGNKFKAEKAANEEFARRVQVQLGQIIVESDQNIDDTDLYKVSTTPGFMTIETIELDKIKNVDAFNKAVTDMIDNTKSLDVSNPSAKRIAVILNIADKTRDYIDYSFSVIKSRFGTPYEIFSHIQNEGSTEWISIIVAGLDMPIDEVNEIYENYLAESNKVNKEKDKFFDFASALKGNDKDSMFNMTNKNKEVDLAKNRSAFFNNLGVNEPKRNIKVTETLTTEETLQKKF